ncbi:hypothetical protein ACWGLS_31090, partial [Streptomyces albidoflavus]
TCTSFDQLNLATAQGAQTLKSATGCALNITGGLKVTARASGDVPVPAALTLAEFKLAVQTDVHVPE